MASNIEGMYIPNRRGTAEDRAAASDIRKRLQMEEAKVDLGKKRITDLVRALLFELVSLDQLQLECNIGEATLLRVSDRISTIRERLRLAVGDSTTPF
jgi:hypothetical protein